MLQTEHQPITSLLLFSFALLSSFEGWLLLPVCYSKRLVAGGLEAATPILLLNFLFDNLQAVTMEVLGISEPHVCRLLPIEHRKPYQSTTGKLVSPSATIQWQQGSQHETLTTTSVQLEQCASFSTCATS